MLEQNEVLKRHFSTLRDSRSGPVFFIEHGLEHEELADLTKDVCAAHRIYSLDSTWWDNCPLPILIVATEVGYRYRGAGTDFWPLLEEVLGNILEASARQRLVELFIAASDQYVGVRPQHGPWANAFHFIAWPIAHALAPVEFHRPLAAALANLRVKSTDVDDIQLYSALHFAAGRSNARFATFLENSTLVVAIARHVLGEKRDDYFHATMTRISSDIASDHVAKRDVSTAKSIQKSLQHFGVGKIIPRSNEQIVGRLQLRRESYNLYLEAQFPSIDSEVLDRLRRAVRQARYSPRLWGVTARIPAEQLLASVPFTLGISAAPDHSAALLTDLNTLEVGEDIKALLSRYTLSFSTPMIFALGADGLARSVIGRELSGYRKYWLLLTSDRAAELGKFDEVGTVGPFSCIELDPRTSPARDALFQLGFHVTFGVSVGFAGDAPLNRDTLLPDFSVGDIRFLVQRREHHGGVTVNMAGQEVLIQSELVRISIPKGEHTLSVSNDGHVRRFRFRGVEPLSKARANLVSLELLTADFTVQSLLAGSVSLRVDSMIPIEGLELRIKIEAEGRSFCMTTHLGPLPQVIAGSDELWRVLLDESTRQVLARSSRASIVVHAGSLASCTWELERRIRSCWWDTTGDTALLQSELGTIPYEFVSALQPLTRPADRPADDHDIQLLVPSVDSTRVDDPAAEFVTRCVSPRRLLLEAPILSKPRLLRQMQSGRKAIGLEDLFSAYFRWVLAESSNLIAEVRRRQIVAQIDLWVAETCCGDLWMLAESKRTHDGDPWQLFLECCSRTGIFLDRFVDLPKSDEDILCRLVVSEIRRTFPKLWEGVSNLDQSEYQALNISCSQAYTELADNYRVKGNDIVAKTIESGDPTASPTEWEKILAEVKAATWLHSLGSMLLPTAQTSDLLHLNFVTMTFKELHLEFVRWTRNSKKGLAGPVPSEEALEIILRLWLSPATAVSMNWRSVLDVLLTERIVARAARYLALRSRQSRGASIF